MKKILVLVTVLFLLQFAGNAQNYVQIGPTAYPMGAWGGQLVGDFNVAPITSRLSFGAGAMLFANAEKSHDLPNEGLRTNTLYAAPQVSLNYGAADWLNLYLRGGAGWLGEKTEGKDINNKFMYNAVAGLGFSLGRYFGVYVEGGLPFSSLGLRFNL